jgi:hypothetical protein
MRSLVVENNRIYSWERTITQIDGGKGEEVIDI